MENDFDLKQSFEDAIKNIVRSYAVVDGTISAINSDNTCDVVVNNQTFYSAPISVLIGSQASIYPVPVLNTACLLGFRDGNFSEPQIIAIDQVDKWLINANLVSFNGGNNGGMVLVNDLVEQMNTIISQQNEILAILQAIIVPTTVPYPFEPLFAGVEPLEDVTADNLQSTVITQ